MNYYYREKKEWYDSTLAFVRKLSQMSVRFDEEQSKFFIDLSVWNAVMATAIPYTLCVDYNTESSVIKACYRQSHLASSLIP